VIADRTLQLVRTGYPWGARLRAGAVAVPVRLLGRRAALVGGPEGVRRFYDPRLRRRGAVPVPVRRVLFGAGTVHGLDDAEHHSRKAMFVDVLNPEDVATLGGRAETLWRVAARGWPDRPRVVLFDEAVQVLAAAVLPWAGVPLRPQEGPLRARQLAAVVDGFASPGPAYLRAVVARAQLDRWSRRLVRGVRAGRISPPADTALHVMASGRDRQGRLLPVPVAATELLNVLRPTVAVAWFVASAGLALHRHPAWRERIAGGDGAALVAFTQEVRRCYPFVPVLAARAREEQDVLGVTVPRGGFVLLDVHGTDHDPAHWPDPDRFDPDRFLTGTVEPDALVPQGGGDVTTGHRCPGEEVAITMITVATRVLAGVSAALPAQDLGYDLSRMPTRPRSGVVLSVSESGGDPALGADG
jgi:fatty-acid peroxygenase